MRAQLATGSLLTAWDAQHWLAERFGVAYTHKGPSFCSTGCAPVQSALSPEDAGVTGDPGGVEKRGAGGRAQAAGLMAAD